MTDQEERKGPSRYQAKVWTDTVLEHILDGQYFIFHKLMSTKRFKPNADQIGRYFPDFGVAYSIWEKNNCDLTQSQLKIEAEKVLLALPVPYEHPDVCYELDAAEEEINRLRMLFFGPRDCKNGYKGDWCEHCDMCDVAENICLVDNETAPVYAEESND